MNRAIKAMAIVGSFFTLTGCPSMAEDNLTRVPVSAPVDTDAAGRAGENALQSVVRIICRKEGTSGTGFIHKSGKIITAAHVTAGCTQPTVVGSDGTELFGKTEAHDDDLDLAILSTTFPLAGRSLPISDQSDLKIGTQVTTWGFPGGYTGASPLLSVGYLSGIQGFRRASDRSVFKQWVVNAAFNSGNSGGPLLHLETGAVIGVVSSKLAPISEETSKILEILLKQQSGMIYTATTPTGETINVSEASLIGRVLDHLRRQVQLVIGYAATSDDLRAFLTKSGIDP